MSKNNGSAFSRLSQFYPSNHTSPASSNDTATHSAESNLLIPPQESLSTSYSASIKRPYSSVKQLDLSPQLTCDQPTSNKRLRANNEEASLSSSFLLDSFRKSNDQFAFQRPSSRLSISTASSTSTTPALYKKHLFSAKKFPTADVYDAKRSNNLNNSASSLYGQSSSHFYPGKTTFGGANLRKNAIRRFSTTPYALSNVRTIEAKSSLLNSSQQSASFSTLNNDHQLSSVTQRVLESLEKAATPFQDAKRRGSISTSLQSTPYGRPSLPASKTALTSKLFDSPAPNVKNNGRCNVDFSYKPIKYVLTPALSNEGDEEVSKVNSKFSADIEKLNEIRQAERELAKKKESQHKVSRESNAFQLRKDCTHGKVTQRDVKKDRKLDDDNYEDNSDHLNALATVKPLTVPVPTLKPFALSFATSNEDSSVDVEAPKETKTRDAASVLFQFSSPTSVSPLAKLSNEDPGMKVNIGKSILAEESFSPKSKEPERFSTTTSNSSSLFVSSPSKPTNEIDGSFISKVKESAISPLNTNISLFEQFTQKKTSNTWCCSACCVDNEMSDDKCVSCEEPNPNKKNSAALAPAKPMFQFGAFAAPKSATNLLEVAKPEASVGENTSKDDDHLDKKLDDTSLFQFSSPATVAPLTLSYNADPYIEVNFSAPVNISKPISTEFSTLKLPESESVSVTSKSPSLPTLSKPNELDDTGRTSKPKESSTAPLSGNISLIEQFKQKKPSTTWSCQVCCVDNDMSDANCVSCEAPNPNKKNAAASAPTKPMFQFGAFATPKPTLPETTQADLSSTQVNKPEDKKPNVTSGFHFSSAAIVAPVSSASTDSAPNFKFSNPNSAAATEPVENSPSLFTFGSKSTEFNKASTVQPTALGFQAFTSTASNSSSFKFANSIGEKPAVSSFGNFFGGNQPSQSVVPTFGSTAFPAVPQSNSGFKFNAEPKANFTSLTAPVSETKTNTADPVAPVSQTSSVDFKFSAEPKVNFSQFSAAVPATTSSSLFSFSAPSTTSTAASLSLASNFSFGSPVTIPKIDVGPPVQMNPKLSINFTQASSTSTTPSNTSAPLFTFGSKSNAGTNSLSSVFGGNSSGEKKDVQFSFGANPTASTNNQSVPNLFGSSATPSFNFGANAAAPATGNSASLFSFGAKLPENSQPPAPVQPAGFNFQAPTAAAVSNSTPFAFGQSANPAPAAQPTVPSFGNMFGATQPAIPSFGSATFPATPQTNTAFKFNADPNFATFAAPAAVDPTNNSGNMFQFNASESASGMAANRQIKKAKRRLR